MSEAQKIFPIDLVIKAMKDNGYKDAAHAVAELIDNSIQAGTDRKDTKVELICLESPEFCSDRNSKKIDKIAVYDNACGMTVDVLRRSLAFGVGSRLDAKKGIGKFGMGLPNASISQCNRVDVYSWVNGIVHHTWLDINSISKTGIDTVPEPVRSEIPKEWKTAIQSEIGESGTLVVWSDLDRLKWKRHKAFFSNVSFIVGRMYRYFIFDKSVSIRLVAICDGEKTFDEEVKPNDPLYLMPNSSTPAPFDKLPGFVLLHDEDFCFDYLGKEYKVRLKFSVCNNEFRKRHVEYYPEDRYKDPGSTPFGKHCQKNIGISVVRAGRELEINGTFINGYDPTERWWGGEISFDPDLDEIFGVTNNKQSATAFKKITGDDVANDEGINSKIDAINFLRKSNDIRLPVVEITTEIDRILTRVRKEIDRQNKGERAKAEYSQSEADKAESAATEALKNSPGEGASDRKDRELSEEEKKQEYKDELERDGLSLTDDDRNEIIRAALSSEDRFVITSSNMPASDVIFDVTIPSGKLKVTLNESHPFYVNIIKNASDSNPQAYDMLRLLFSAWAAMEDRCHDSRQKEWMIEARKEWGHFSKKMLNEYLKI